MTDLTKNRLLIAGVVVLLFLTYTFAFKETFSQIQQYQSLKQQDALFKNAPGQLALLHKKTIYYDSLLTKYQRNGSSVQNSLLKTINAFAEANGLKVISFLEPHILTQSNLTVKTYTFVVQGSYNSINSLIYRLEQHTKFGEISNLHFEKKKNFRTGKYYLQAKILLTSFV